MKKIIGIVLIALSIILIFMVMYLNSRYSKINRTFAPYTLLTSSWEKYKQKFINADGRVIDFSQNEVTTSEGQSYGMLRAVWSDDRETFEKVWKFTKQNMKRDADNLFGWRWGKLGDEKYGFLPDGGDNAASDADQDIALALILAANRWKNNQYKADAKIILKDLWDYETAEANGKRYMIAGNWANQPNELIINPSYFGPYAWRVFAKVDKDHDWNSLIDPAYQLLNDVGSAKLDKAKGVGLPPNWLSIDKKSGELRPPSIGNANTDYSFDAMRTPWRIALDHQWNNEPRAKAYLENSYTHLINEYKTNNKIFSSYNHEGIALTTIENPVMYATILGNLLVIDKDLAQKMYTEKIIKLYSNADNTFDSRLPYYEQNWLWFGLALYNNQLRNY